VAFGEAVYEGRQTIEGVSAELVRSADEADTALARGIIPVLIDPNATSLSVTRPHAVVDAIVAKRNTGTHARMAPLVVALGPGFSAPADVDAVIETNRGPDLGRVIWQGQAERNSGEPSAVLGIKGERVLRAPTGGILHTCRAIGESVKSGQLIATVGDAPIQARFTGMIRGLAREGLRVEAGAKVGDLDPRLDRTLCTRVSDKALAVAGGVLEALLCSLRRINT
jgi:xanthine dehydrogenase accessory factor